MYDDDVDEACCWRVSLEAVTLCILDCLIFKLAFLRATGGRTDKERNDLLKTCFSSALLTAFSPPIKTRDI